MKDIPDSAHKLPSPDLSHAYTIAMHLAQQLEINLRAFLYTADYHAFIDIPLTEEQKKRYRDANGFIDNATCGSLLAKLRGVTTIKSKKAWQTFNRACEHRNRLAHSFLVEHDFDHMWAEQEQVVITDLRSMIADISDALLFSRLLRERVEVDSDAAHESMKRTMAVLGVPNYENPKRKYVPAKKRKVS